MSVCNKDVGATTIAQYRQTMVSGCKGSGIEWKTVYVTVAAKL